MMINKRLIGTVAESKKYIAGNVASQWVSLCSNVVIMGSIANFVGGLAYDKPQTNDIILLVLTIAICVAWVPLTGNRQRPLRSCRFRLKVLNSLNPISVHIFRNFSMR